MQGDGGDAVFQFPTELLIVPRLVLNCFCFVLAWFCARLFVCFTFCFCVGFWALGWVGFVLFMCRVGWD